MKMILLLAAVVCFSPDQSLVELAAKAKSAPKATRVYTDKDMPKMAPSPAVVAVVPDVDKPVATAPEPIAVEKTATYWKNRMRALVTQKDYDARQLVASVATLNTARVYYAETTGRIANLAAARQMYDALADTRRLSALVDSDTATIKDLEEEARTAGALPGWLRPW